MPDPKFEQLPPDLSRLHKLLVDYFDLDGIRTLCFDISVRYDDLRGETITAKVVALLQHLDRIKRIEALLEYAERKRPNVDWRGGPLPEAICPYKGLHAFSEADKDNFFGRDEFTNKLVAAVNKQSLVAVVGPSGGGKSSVVFAGLLPTLVRAGSWLVMNFRPGNDPFLNLAKALVPLIEPTTSKLKIPVVARQKLKPFLGGENKAERIPLADYLQQIQEDHRDQKLLLIVDQFEELYTQVEQTVRRDFLDVLLAAGFGQSALATPAHTFATLLLTMRADFMGQALAYPPMVDALQDNDVKIGLMSKDELALAIEQPALNQSVRFADGLVTRILEDVGDHAGNLPLLEFALTLLWDRQTNRQMTHDAYEAIGGVSGALAQHADETLTKLTQNDSEKIQAIQRVMVQLVQPGAGAEDTRRVARRADLGDAGWTLAQRLAAEDARLLVTGQGNEDAETTETVEVIHEALIQNWGQLQEWMEKDREFRMWQERLRSDLALWQKNEKQKGYLLQGAPLTLAEGWLERRRDDLNLLEVEYIEASLRKRKGDNFRRIGIGILVSLLLIGASIIVAIIQSQAATDIGIEATKGAIAQVTAVALAATSDHNVGLAITREVEAEQSAAEAATAKAEEAERATEANARYLMSQAQVVFEDDPQLGLILALESLTLADEIGAAETILDESNGRDNIFNGGRSLSLGTQIEQVALSPNESVLLVDHVDAPGELRNSTDGFLIASLSSVVDKWEFNSNGSRMLIKYVHTPRELRDGADGTLIETLVGEVEDYRFSPNGSVFLVDYDGARGELRDSADGTLIETLTNEVKHLQFSPNGSRLIVNYWDDTWELRDGIDGALMKTLTGDVLVGFNTDGSLMEVRYWEGPPWHELRDGNNGTQIANLSGVQKWEFSPNAGRLLVDYHQESGELRNGASGALIASLDGVVDKWEFSSNESRLLVTYVPPMELELRDGADGDLIETFAGQVWDYGFNTDGSRLIVEYQDVTHNFNLDTYSYTWELRDGTDGDLIETFAGQVVDYEFNNDGNLLIVAYQDDAYNFTYELRDGTNGTLIETLGGNSGEREVWWKFSPNGSRLLVTYSDTPGELRDGADGTLIETLAGVTTGGGFSPDESLLVIVYEDGTSSLLETINGVALAPIGTGLRVATEFISTTQKVLDHYQNGQAYLLDLAWLEAMNGEVETLPLSELIQLACQYPLDNGAVLNKPEVRAALEPYLEQVGLEEPQACQTMQ